MTVLDLFCGAGGLSYGFKKAGFNVVAGIDSWKPAVETFRKNHIKSQAILADISELSDSYIKSHFGGIDIVIVSIP